MRIKPFAAEVQVFHKDIPAYVGKVIIPQQAKCSTGDALRAWVFGHMPEATDYSVTPLDLGNTKKYLAPLTYHNQMSQSGIMGCYTGTGVENWQKIEDSLDVPIEERVFN